MVGGGAVERGGREWRGWWVGEQCRGERKEGGKGRGRGWWDVRRKEGGVKVGWDTGEDGGGGEREEEQERGRGRSGTRHLEGTLHLLK